MRTFPFQLPFPANDDESGENTVLIIDELPSVKLNDLGDLLADMAKAQKALARAVANFTDMVDDEF